jgi:hypothetical protein
MGEANQHKTDHEKAIAPNQDWLTGDLRQYVFE